MILLSFTILRSLLFYSSSLHSALLYSTPNQCSGSKHGDSNKSKSSSAEDIKAVRKEMAEHKERADGYLVQLQDGAKYVQTMREQLEEVRTNIQLHIIICYYLSFVVRFISFHIIMYQIYFPDSGAILFPECLIFRAFSFCFVTHFSIEDYHFGLLTPLTYPFIFSFPSLPFIFTSCFFLFSLSSLVSYTFT